MVHTIIRARTPGAIIRARDTRMGGYGSGRRSWSRNVTCDYPRLDVRTLHRDRLLTVGCSVGFTCSRNGQAFATINLRRESDGVVLIYRHCDDHGQNWQSDECAVMLEWTRCNYGGKRVWFVCPTRACGRRVAVLYGGGVFACRHCHQLVYESQRMPAHDRALRKAQAIRVKLGGSGSMADFFPPKPKGMHYQTYERLSMEAKAADRRSWPRSLLRLLNR